MGSAVTSGRNAATSLDLDRIARLRVDPAAVERRVAAIRAIPRGPARRADVLLALRSLDLTTLDRSDTPGRVVDLCRTAARGVGDPPVRVAAVCVFAELGVVAHPLLSGSSVRLALVAAGFPLVDRPLARRIEDVRRAVDSGADEIDAVATPALIERGAWTELYDEIAALRVACGSARLKTILGTGMLDSLARVAQASAVACAAGSDFLKTSTGKDAVNATLEAGVIMAEEIRVYFERTGTRVGLKAAGGVRTADEALAWVGVVRSELREEWLTPQLFRIGASALLGALEEELSTTLS